MTFVFGSYHSPRSFRIVEIFLPFEGSFKALRIAAAELQSYSEFILQRRSSPLLSAVAIDLSTQPTRDILLVTTPIS